MSLDPGVHSPHATSGVEASGVQHGLTWGSHCTWNSCSRRQGLGFCAPPAGPQPTRRSEIHPFSGKAARVPAPGTGVWRAGGQADGDGASSRGLPAGHRCSPRRRCPAAPRIPPFALIPCPHLPPTALRAPVGREEQCYRRPSNRTQTRTPAQLLALGAHSALSSTRHSISLGSS